MTGLVTIVALLGAVAFVVGPVALIAPALMVGLAALVTVRIARGVHVDLQGQVLRARGRDVALDVPLSEFVRFDVGTRVVRHPNNPLAEPQTSYGVVIVSRDGSRRWLAGERSLALDTEAREAEVAQELETWLAAARAAER